MNPTSAVINLGLIMLMILHKQLQYRERDVESEFLFHHESGDVTRI